MVRDGNSGYNRKNVVMAICFAIAALVTGAPALRAQSPHRVASVVRVDTRTGRLVRTTVAEPGWRTPQGPVSKAPQALGRKTPQAPATLQVGPLVTSVAKAHDVDPLLVHSVIAVESNYNQYAVSPKGAQGLMQLIPSTAQRFGAADTFDIRQNIEAGVKYLKYLQDKFGDNRLALAAYNAGEGAVEKYHDVPPYAETKQYVLQVGRKYGEARRGTTDPQPAPPPAPPSEPVYRNLKVQTDAAGHVLLLTTEEP
jgi:soluble lytic murein transglycosylase-like protein